MMLFRWALLIIVALIPVHDVIAKGGTKPIEIRSDKAYLLFQLDHLLYEPEGKNTAKMAVTFARYDPVANGIRGLQFAKDNPVPEGEELRVQRLKKPLVTGKKKQLFLLEVSPDTWILENVFSKSGANAIVPNTAFSLSSYYFTAQAGKITNLGVLTPVRPISDNPDTELTAGKLLRAAFLGAFAGQLVEPVPLELRIRPFQPGDVPLPSSIDAALVVYPEMTYGGLFPNLSGGLVNRIDGKAGRNRQKGEKTYITAPPEIAERLNAERVAAESQPDAAAPMIAEEPPVATTQEPVAG